MQTEKDGYLPALAIAAIAIIAVQAFLATVGETSILDGNLRGPDSYMRVNRVIQLWQTGAWFDLVFHRIDPPNGHIQHWTRPMDLILLAGALIGTPIFGFETALHGWAVAASPVLHLAALIASIWAAAAIVARRHLWLVAFLFILQPGIFNAFMVGRPDHQGLILLTMIVIVGINLRLLGGSSRPNLAVFNGIACTLALWVSIETLIVVVFSIAALALRWLLVDRHAARILAIQSAVLVVGIFAALIVERGANAISAPEYDVISTAHLGLFAINGAVWFVLGALTATSKPGTGFNTRAGVAFILACVGGSFLWLVFPGLLTSPLDAVDPLYRQARLEKIVEFQPLLGGAAIAANGLVLETARASMWLGQAVVALAWAIWLSIAIAREKADPGRFGHDFGHDLGRDLCQWAYLGTGLALFMGLTISSIRWVPYQSLFALITYSALCAALLKRIEDRVAISRLVLVRPITVVALCLWPYAPLVSMQGRFEAAVAQAAKGHCNLRRAAQTLARDFGETPKRLVAFVDFGPELLYRTPHSVYSIPNHRHQPGFTMTYRAMTETDFEIAERILRDRGAELVLVCGAGAPTGFYGSRPDYDAVREPTLHEALVAGFPPAYLAEQPLPVEAQNQLKLYVVAP